MIPGFLLPADFSHKNFYLFASFRRVSNWGVLVMTTAPFAVWKIVRIGLGITDSVVVLQLPIGPDETLSQQV